MRHISLRRAHIGPRLWDLISRCHGLTSIDLTIWWPSRHSGEDIEADCAVNALEADCAVNALQTKRLESLDLGRPNHCGAHKPEILARLASSFRHLQVWFGDHPTPRAGYQTQVIELLRACPRLTTLTIHSFGNEFPILPREVGFLSELRVPSRVIADVLRLSTQESKLQKVKLNAGAYALWPFLATNMQLKEAELETRVTSEFAAQVARMPNTTFHLRSLEADIACLQGLGNIVNLTLEKPVAFDASVVATLARLQRLVLVVEAWTPYFLAPLATLPLLTG